MAETLVSLIEPTINNGIASAGTAIDTTNGNSFSYGQLNAVFIHNTDASNTLTVTITSQTDAAGKSKTIAITIAADGYGVINLLDQGFSDGGLVKIAYSGTSTTGFILPVALVRL